MRLIPLLRQQTKNQSSVYKLKNLKISEISVIIYIESKRDRKCAECEPSSTQITLETTSNKTETR